MATRRIKLLPIALLAAPATALACSHFFYPAPPTLDHYPERLPGKTMSELFREANPPAPDAATFYDLFNETSAIADGVGSVPRDQLTRRIDKVLARNRAGEYRKRFSNCLYDLRDLLAVDGPPAEEAHEYAKWRVSIMDADTGFFASEEPDLPASDDERKTVDALAAKESRDKIAAVPLEKKAGSASPALKPHWLVQAGAWQFKNSRFEEAAQLFQQVIDSAPQHPRAEVAQLMLARARIELWIRAKDKAVSEGKTPDQAAGDQYGAAVEALNAYAKKYPKGRFAPDIPGWRGGLAREAGEPIEAIGEFLQQMDFRDHPEIVRGAVRECEGCLRDLDARKVEGLGDSENTLGTLPYAEIARRPMAALAVVYHFLDAGSRQDFDDLIEHYEMPDSEITRRHLEPMLRIRRAGREILPALARAVADQKENYGGAVWRPKYLAVLAWAASETGEQQQAIRLCELAGPALNTSDDLQFAYAVSLQRNGQLDAAIDAFRRIEQTFPDSPFNAETQFRVAMALRDKHEAGIAAAEILRIVAAKDESRNARAGDPDTAEPPETTGLLRLRSELNQWADTLLQFASVSEIERGLSLPDLEPAIADSLRTIARTRALAREDFATAVRFAERPVAEETEAASGMFNQPLELHGEEWLKAIRSLQKLKKDAATTKNPAERASHFFALAEAWSSFRGRLTLASLDVTVPCNDFYLSWGQRYRNSQMIGIIPAAAAAELEDRDELRHAYHYYLEAANLTKDPELKARALWRANDAIRKMAELSPWSSDRAFTTNASEQSHQLHQRLLRECPDTEEAKTLSMWWTFPPAAELQWMPHDNPDYDVEVSIADAFRGFHPTPTGYRESPEWREYPEFDQRLAELLKHRADWNTEKMLAELAAIRRDFLPVFVNARGAHIMNHLDDLELFLHEPNLTPDARATYIEARLGNAPIPVAISSIQPWLDYFTFRALVVEGDNQEHPRPMAERMREFLDKFPKSKKRDAALARLTISTVREIHGKTRVANTNWPEAPKLGGYKAIEVIREKDPFDGKAAFAALDAYDREFPQGRYRAEIRLWRGIAALDSGNIHQAMKLLVATLDDPDRHDLHLDASLNLAALFMRLLDHPEERPEIIGALRDNPAAQKRFYQFANSDTLGARLRCMEEDLRERWRR